MSYCRKHEKDSDVYVVRHGDEIECMGCDLRDESGKKVGAFSAPDERTMIAHLLLHRIQRHRVPDRALNRLRHERDGIPWPTDVQKTLGELLVPSPTCPLCGQLPAMVVGEHQAFCGDDDCKVLMWDPTKTREENFAKTRVVDLQVGDAPDA